MEFANQTILLCGALLLVSILAGVLSSRVGAPLLLVFLSLGMLAGEEGIGGIGFGDFQTAYLVGSLALAIILFDGGLRTPVASVRLAWKPASALATVGVVVTAGITGGLAVLVLDLGLLLGMLLGAIVASTDAAAVFLLLHQRGMELHKRVSTTLEIESGANDPVAVILTVTLVGLLAGSHGLGPEVLAMLAEQLVLGAALGLAGGYLLALVVNRLELAPGLYPVFVAAGALVVFGGTQVVGGSGFLAVYLAGIVAGNRKLRANTLIHRFHDGIAWIAQIVMFVMLGLLVTPTRLIDDLPEATFIALTLIFVARPAAVLACLLPFRFGLRERLFIAWVGLRGAVPIFLAMIPMLGGATYSLYYFNVAFLVVVTSLLLQGWTIPWVARLLGVELPPVPEPAARSEIDLPSHLDRDVIGYRVDASSVAAARPLDELPLPRRARVMVVLRDSAVVPRATLRQLLPGDYVLAICPPEQVLVLDRIFGPRAARLRAAEAAPFGEFILNADAPMMTVAALYDLPVAEGEMEATLGDFVAERLGTRPAVGDHVRTGTVELVVHEVAGDVIRRIGVRLEPLQRRDRLRRLLRPAAWGGFARQSRRSGRSESADPTPPAGARSEGAE